MELFYKMRRTNEASDNTNINSTHNLLEHGTARPQTDHVLDIAHTSGDNSQQLLQPQIASQASNAVTNRAVSPRQRNKWTLEMNEYLLRTYFQITNLETNRTLFRKRVLKKFTEKYPQIVATEQSISDQIRAIRRNDYVNEARRDQIRQEVALELQETIEPLEDDDPHVETEQRVTLEPTLAVSAENEISNDDELIQLGGESIQNQGTCNRTSTESVDKECLREYFNQNYATYNGMNVTNLPPLPRLNSSTRLAKLTEMFNQHIIPDFLKSDINLEEIVQIVYCAAKTITETLLNKKYDPSERNRRLGNPRSELKRSRQPAWLRRLNKTIEEHRRKIGKLTAYINGTRSAKLIKEAKRICKSFNRHSRFETNEEIPHRTLDTLKQKLRTLCTRREKYRVSLERKKHNHNFESNQKLFFRKLKSGPGELRNSQTLQAEVLTTYWSSIWSQRKNHNATAQWILELKAKHAIVAQNSITVITQDNISEVTKNLHNWKAPGCDQVHAYWYKKLTCTHEKIAELLAKIISGAEEAPNFLTLGTTFLIHKGGETSDPAAYRPITCLPVIYKILTSCISNMIYDHAQLNGVLAEEQKGCVRASQGCKEQLIIDQVILGQVKKQNRNLYAAYIDWQKAYDSVPHSWLIAVLRLYGVNETITSFLQRIMQNWRTRIKLPESPRSCYTNEIAIRSGIFQGDSLSPLWFIISMNPLSDILKKTGYGYGLKYGDARKLSINHLFYVDDLKLYAGKEKHLEKLIECVISFSKDIRMPIGFDKCRKIKIVKGKVINVEPAAEDNTTVNIKEMEKDEVYKYLGLLQSNIVETMQMRKKLIAEYKRRLHVLCKTNLNGNNQIRAINSFVIPVISYSFGIVKWSTTELNNLERMMRTIMTKHKCHHPKSSVLRFALPRKEGGRGAIDVGALHDKLILKLRNYFYGKAGSSELHHAVSAADDKFTPLRMMHEFNSRNTTTKLDKVEQWSRMPIHGVYYNELKSPHVDAKLSHSWLINKGIFAETESAIFAMQDGVVPTRNYVKYVIREPNAPKDICRRCGGHGETLNHVLAGCTLLTNSFYLKRHNDVAKIIHLRLAQMYDFHREKTPYYRYVPEPVHEDNNMLLYYDRTILTNTTRTHNRPDIFVINKNDNTAFVIDIGVPLNKNIHKTYTEKISKYSDLGIDIKRQWKLRKVFILPLIISAHGFVHVNLAENLKKLKLEKHLIYDLQKAALLNSCHIIRNFLQ